MTDKKEDAYEFDIDTYLDAEQLIRFNASPPKNITIKDFSKWSDLPWHNLFGAQKL